MNHLDGTEKFNWLRYTNRISRYLNHRGLTHHTAETHCMPSWVVLSAFAESFRWTNLCVLEEDKASFALRRFTIDCNTDTNG